MTSQAELIGHLMRRELAALSRELLAYPDERSVWQCPAGVPNSAGNLALHVVGNLRYFVGGVLGQSGYVRDRPAEFASREVPRAELIQALETARAEVERALAALTPEAFAAPFPIEYAERRFQTDEFLLHLLAHLAYHLGQIDYHRRVVTGDGKAVGAVLLSELSTARPAG